MPNTVHALSYTHRGTWDKETESCARKDLQFKETKHSISSTEGWKLVFFLKQIKWKYYSTFKKFTEGQTPTLCFYTRSAFCKHLEAYLKNHPSTHIHLPLHLCASPLQHILWFLASLGLNAALDCHALTAYKKWPLHSAFVCVYVCVCVSIGHFDSFSQIKKLKTNEEQPSNLSLSVSAGWDLIRFLQ